MRWRLLRAGRGKGTTWEGSRKGQGRAERPALEAAAVRLQRAPLPRPPSRSFGKAVSFLPKPMRGAAGNGLHCHMSLMTKVTQPHATGRSPTQPRSLAAAQPPPRSSAAPRPACAAPDGPSPAPQEGRTAMVSPQGTGELGEAADVLYRAALGHAPPPPGHGAAEGAAHHHGAAAATSAARTGSASLVEPASSHVGGM
jgi:hypothetical protein